MQGYYPVVSLNLLCHCSFCQMGSRCKRRCEPLLDRLYVAPLQTSLLSFQVVQFCLPLYRILRWFFDCPGPKRSNGFLCMVLAILYQELLPAHPGMHPVVSMFGIALLILVVPDTGTTC